MKTVQQQQQQQQQYLFHPVEFLQNSYNKVFTKEEIQ